MNKLVALACVSIVALAVSGVLCLMNGALVIGGLLLWCAASGVVAFFWAVIQKLNQDYDAAVRKQDESRASEIAKRDGSGHLPHDGC